MFCIINFFFNFNFSILYIIGFCVQIVVSNLKTKKRSLNRETENLWLPTNISPDYANRVELIGECIPKK